jgi:hypothetical protein
LVVLMKRDGAEDHVKGMPIEEFRPFVKGFPKPAAAPALFQQPAHVRTAMLCFANQQNSDGVFAHGCSIPHSSVMRGQKL